MKKLGKLSINLNKVIKNEELVNLRGGYGSYNLDKFLCFCGQTGGSGEASPFEVCAIDGLTALSMSVTACGGVATCSATGQVCTITA